MSTPVQRQYWELKNKNPDAILFFRLGDFYEMFFEDAQLCSRLLGIVLTARHKGTENEMPMCGFPYHAHEEYLEKLVNEGYKVAIAEQEEEPATHSTGSGSSAKKISRRVVRVVTPGASLEKGTLEPEKNAFLVAILRNKNTWTLAYADLSTGDFRVTECEDEISFLDELYKLAPREILIPTELFEDELFCKKLPETHITVRKNVIFSDAEECLKEHFKIQSLTVFGIEKNPDLTRVSAQILMYLQETQKTDLSHISTLICYSSSEVMQLDAQTFRHLEIFEPFQNGDNSATLWSIFERSLTALGARKLRQWLSKPLLSQEKIMLRQEAVQEIVEEFEFQKLLAEAFKQISDIERLHARVVTQRVNGRDMALLRNSFSVFPKVSAVCEKAQSVLLREKAEVFKGLQTLTQKLMESLVDSPPIEITQGSIFRDGFSVELDELRQLSKNSKVWLEDFLVQKKKESGIQNLRIKYSNNFGFCLEVSSAQAKNVPTDWIRRQTLVNAERFTTPELAQHEEKVLSAESRMYELEHQLFLKLRKEVLTHSSYIQKSARAVAEIDALFTLARTAKKFRWSRPEILANSDLLEIKKGRHPVVEKISTETFIANDLVMASDSRFHLITGPNMAGKSTFLRQNAILILLAQIGSFVPAKTMKCGIFDRVFTRVGASDNLAGGKSTFFVEMAETARILLSATKNSFVILDEIGRGTSTFDGISLAWAITEFLHNDVQCKTLFATHFHELTGLMEDLPGAYNYHVSATQDEKGITFLRRVQKGGISESFGIDVARSAGVPEKVVRNAREVLGRLESENLLSGKATLFSLARQHESVEKVFQKSEAEEILENVNPEELTPRKALDILFEIKKKII